METRFAAFWRNRVAIWIGSLAIWLVTSAASPLQPPVDAEMVERAVNGAEWLAERAKSAPERMETAAIEPDLTSWLLVAGGATGPEYETFAAYLPGIGYDDTLVPVQDWLQEFSGVLAAAEAHQRSAEIRSMADVQAEMRSLPILPLDENGEAKRDRLMDELNFASIPDDERRAANAAQGRISALKSFFMQETRR